MPRGVRCPVEYGSRSSAPAESECPSTAHRGHSSAVEPHGSSEAACGQHSEHSGIVAAWTVARGRRLTRRHPYSRNLGYRPRPFIEHVRRSSAAAPGPVRGSRRAVRSSPLLLGVAHAWRRGGRPGRNSRLPPRVLGLRVRGRRTAPWQPAGCCAGSVACSAARCRRNAAAGLSWVAPPVHHLRPRSSMTSGPVLTSAFL